MRVGFSAFSESFDTVDARSNVVANNEFASFALEASDVIYESNVRAVASWGGHSALTRLQQAGLVMTMAIQLQHAEVFAWEWRCVQPGISDSRS